MTGGIRSDIYAYPRGYVPDAFRGGDATGGALSLPFVPPTRGNQVMRPDAHFNINKVAQINLKDVQAEISERISGELTKGRLDNVSDADLRKYLNTHLSYLNEVIPDALALGKGDKATGALAQELINQFGEVELFASGIDQIGSPESKAPFGQAEYEKLASNFSEAQQALVLVS